MKQQFSQLDDNNKARATTLSTQIKTGFQGVTVGINSLLSGQSASKKLQLRTFKSLDMLQASVDKCLAGVLTNKKLLLKLKDRLEEKKGLIQELSEESSKVFSLFTTGAKQGFDTNGDGKVDAYELGGIVSMLGLYNTPNKPKTDGSEGTTTAANADAGASWYLEAFQTLSGALAGQTCNTSPCAIKVEDINAQVEKAHPAGGVEFLARKPLKSGAGRRLGEKYAMTDTELISFCADNKLLSKDGVDMANQLVESNKKATQKLATWQDFLQKADGSLKSAIQTTGGRLGLKNIQLLVKDTIAIVTAIQQVSKAASDVFTGCGAVLAGAATATTGVGFFPGIMAAIANGPKCITGIMGVCKGLKNLWDASKVFANNLATTVEKGWNAAKDWVATFKAGFTVLVDVLASDRSLLQKLTLGTEIAYNMTSLNKVMSFNDVKVNAKKYILEGQEKFIGQVLKGAKSTIDPEKATEMLNSLLYRMTNETERHEMGDSISTFVKGVKDGTTTKQDFLRVAAQAIDVTKQLNMTNKYVNYADKFVKKYSDDNKKTRRRQLAGVTSGANHLDMALDVDKSLGLANLAEKTRIVNLKFSILEQCYKVKKQLAFAIRSGGKKTQLTAAFQGVDITYSSLNIFLTALQSNYMEWKSETTRSVGW